MNTKRLFTARATAWLLAWQMHATQARLARNFKAIKSARVHALHARTALVMFRAFCNDKPYTNGIPR